LSVLFVSMMHGQTNIKLNGGYFVKTERK
jgi:hypothetical protein